MNPNTGDIAEVKQMMKKEELFENRIWLDKKIKEIGNRIKR
jgi:hypothetical protein